MCYILSMKEINRFFTCLLLFLILSPITAGADLVSYTDENGKTHVVNTDFSEVPAKYRQDTYSEANDPVNADMGSSQMLRKALEKSASSGKPPLLEQIYHVDLFVEADDATSAMVAGYLSMYNLAFTKHNVQELSEEAAALLEQIDGDYNVPFAVINSKVYANIQGPEILDAVQGKSQEAEKPKLTTEGLSDAEGDDEEYDEGYEEDYDNYGSEEDSEEENYEVDSYD